MCISICVEPFQLVDGFWFLSKHKTEEQTQFVASIRRARHDSQFIPVSKTVGCLVDPSRLEIVSYSSLGD